MRITATIDKIQFCLSGDILVSLEVSKGVSAKELQFVLKKLRMLEKHLEKDALFLERKNKNSTAQPTSTEAESKRIFAA